MTSAVAKSPRIASIKSRTKFDTHWVSKRSKRTERGKAIRTAGQRKERIHKGFDRFIGGRRSKG